MPLQKYLVLAFCTMIISVGIRQIHVEKRDIKHISSLYDGHTSKDYKKQEQLGLFPEFGGVHVAHICICLCCALFVIVLLHMCPMLPVSLNSPLLIGPSVFYNVYLEPQVNLWYRIMITTLLNMAFVIYTGTYMIPSCSLLAGIKHHLQHLLMINCLLYLAYIVYVQNIIHNHGKIMPRNARAY